MNLLAVFIGGGLGSLARYGVSLLVTNYFKSHLPWATLGANVFSCIIFGLVLAWYSGKPSFPEANRLFLLVGFCGGFSTFSTFSLETLTLFRNGQSLFAIGNVLLSVALCILILMLITKRIPS